MPWFQAGHEPGIEGRADTIHCHDNRIFRQCGSDCARFQDSDKISRTLKLLIDVGLGYMKMGQPATSFSGGEAQRIKLTKYMTLTQKAHNILFLLDEPATGLHFDDIRRLPELFTRLVDCGNSIICIEHNMDVIKSADHIIDIGPNGGKRGGKIICTGTLEEIIKCEGSYTGKE